MDFGHTLATLRNQSGLNQRDFANALGVSNGAVAMWETNKRQPDFDMLNKIASFFSVSIDVLLGRDTQDPTSLHEFLGLKDRDEEAASFKHKLINQMEFNGTKIQDLAKEIGVSEKTISDWINNKSHDYSQYYQKLSDFFHVQLRYWTSPHSISPGIEPNMEEYLLILLYRSYQKHGILDDTYGSIEEYFPGITIVNGDSEKKLLSIFQELNECNKDIIIGEIRKFIKEQQYEDSVAAEEPDLKTGTDNLGK